jgi:hypothetical protein
MVMVFGLAKLQDFGIDYSNPKLQIPIFKKTNTKPIPKLKIQI